jgi:hypothetical protein
MHAVALLSDMQTSPHRTSLEYSWYLLATRVEQYVHPTCAHLCILFRLSGVHYVASVLLYGCLYGLDYVVVLWSELCVCLCLLL